MAGLPGTAVDVAVRGMVVDAGCWMWYLLWKGTFVGGMLRSTFKTFVAEIAAGTFFQQ